MRKNPDDLRYTGHYDDTNPSMPFPPLLITSREIAKWLRLSPDTVSKLLARGELPGHKDTRGRWVCPTELLIRWCLLQHRSQVKEGAIGPRRVTKKRGVRRLIVGEERKTEIPDA